jgi:putative spermidine/putrescine transport system permease protein
MVSGRLARSPDKIPSVPGVLNRLWLLFLSALIRVYSLELSFGTVGLGRTLSGLMGVSSNSRTYAEFLVVIGLMHHSIPLAALLITATIQNINPRLVEAAQALGAPLWRGHLSITLPLSYAGNLVGISSFATRPISVLSSC